MKKQAGVITMQGRKNMFILLIGVMVLLAGCQSDDKSSTATNESPNIAEAELSYIQDGKEVEASFIAECLPKNDCTKENSFLSQDSPEIAETTEDIKAVKVKPSEPIHIGVNGAEPEQISYNIYYKREDTNRTSFDSGTFNQKQFTLGGSGQKRILIDAVWEDGEGNFIGAKREALVVNL